MNKIVSESPFHAETPLVNPNILFGRHFDHFSIGKGIELQLATTPAESTGGLCLVQLPYPTFDGAQILGQSTNRTDVEALPTGDTIFFSYGLHMGGIPMLCNLQHIRSWNIDAGLNATEAHDTSIGPLTNQRSSIFEGGTFNFFGGKFHMVDPKFIGTVLELTFSSRIAGRTVQGVVDQ